MNMKHDALHPGYAVPDKSAAPASQAQAAPVDMAHVLRTIRNLIDGSQPKDVPGAIAVIDNALKVGIAWSYDVAPPPGFIAYVKANYAGDVHFHDSEWHAVRLWNAAMKNVGARLAAPAVIDQQTAAEIRARALEEAAEVCDAIYQDHRDQYKGRGKYAPPADNPRRADSHCDGCADGAAECEEAIRALASKEAAPAEVPSQSNVVIAESLGDLPMPKAKRDEILNRSRTQGESGGEDE